MHYRPKKKKKVTIDVYTSTGFLDDNVPDGDRVAVHVFIRVQPHPAHWP